jgi:hypothetical protein
MIILRISLRNSSEKTHLLVEAGECKENGGFLSAVECGMILDAA